MQHEFQMQVLAQMDKLLKLAKGLTLSSHNNNSMLQLEQKRKKFKSFVKILEQQFVRTKCMVEKNKICFAKPSVARDGNGKHV